MPELFGGVLISYVVVVVMQLVLANPVGSVMEKLEQSQLLESFRVNGLYLSVGEAVAHISSLWYPQP
jgi:sulfate transporter 3